MRTLPRRLGVLTAVIALTAAGCSSKAADTGPAPVSGDELQTGPGVTEEVIRLGALTDTSGVFGAQGRMIIQGNQLYVDKVNADGGVCGRTIELAVRDHGTDVQQAVSLYAETEPDVLGYVQMLGSPITNALEPEIVNNQTLTVATAWAESLLDNPYMIVIGNTYAIETINGVEYLAREAGLTEGDVIGHIYFEGDFGANAFEGSEYAAEQLGLTVEGIRIQPTDADLTAEVSTLRSRGASAILLSGGPLQTASVAGVAASIGYDVPLLSNTPGFDPSLLDTPAADAIEANLWVLSSYVPFAADTPGAQEVADALPADASPNGMLDLGYVSMLVYTRVLEQACANGDLTRDGMIAAFRELDSVDTDGLTPTLDYSLVGGVPSRETYVQAVDRDVPGGLTILEDAFEGELAQGYAPVG